MSFGSASWMPSGKSVLAVAMKYGWFFDPIAPNDVQPAVRSCLTLLNHAKTSVFPDPSHVSSDTSSRMPRSSPLTQDGV